MAYTQAELKEAITILRRIYLQAVIPNSNGQDHVTIQNCLGKLEEHITSLPADADPSSSNENPSA